MKHFKTNNILCKYDQNTDEKQEKKPQPEKRETKINNGHDVAFTHTRACFARSQHTFGTIGLNISKIK